MVAGQITGGTGVNNVLTLRLVPAAEGSRVRTPNGILHLPGLRLEIVAARPTARLAGRPMAEPAAAKGVEPGDLGAYQHAVRLVLTNDLITSSARGPARSRPCCAGPT